MLKRIHVNQHVIKKNRRDGTSDPCITVKTYKGNHYAMEAVIDGPSNVVYRPDCPLSCGAQIWIETKSPVIVKTEKSNELVLR